MNRLEHMNEVQCWTTDTNYLHHWDNPVVSNATGPELRNVHHSGHIGSPDPLAMLRKSLRKELFVNIVFAIFTIIKQLLHNGEP